MKTKSLDRQMGLNGQGVLYVEILEVLDGVKIRVEIRSDAYDFQSYCTLDVFNKAEGKWHEVLRRPYGNMETRHGLHYEPNIKTCNLSLAFARDRQWLIDTYGKLMS